MLTFTIFQQLLKLVMSAIVRPSTLSFYDGNVKSKFKLRWEERCPVCLWDWEQPYSNVEQACRVLPCGHVMCTTCLRKVIEKRKSVCCPFDRFMVEVFKISSYPMLTVEGQLFFFPRSGSTWSFLKKPPWEVQ